MDEELRKLEQELRAEPRDAKVASAYARALVRAGDRAEAARVLGRAAARTSDPELIRELDLVAPAGDDPTAPWPDYLGGGRRTRRSVATGPDGGAVTHVARLLTRGLSFEPCAVDGDGRTLVKDAHFRRLVAVDVEGRAQELLRSKTGQGPLDAVHLHAGILVTTRDGPGGRDKRLHCDGSRAELRLDRPYLVVLGHVVHAPGGALEAVALGETIPRWRTPLPDSIVRITAAPRGRVYAVTRADATAELHALDLATGEKLWSSSLGAREPRFNVPPTLIADPGGRAFVDHGSELVAVGPEGAVLWTHGSRETGTDFPKANPRVVAGAEGDVIVHHGFESGGGALDAASGRVLWETRDVRLVDAFADARGFVYAKQDRDVVRLEPRTGAVLTRWVLPADRTLLPGVRDYVPGTWGVVPAGEGRIHVLRTNNSGRRELIVLE